MKRSPGLAGRQAGSEAGWLAGWLPTSTSRRRRRRGVLSAWAVAAPFVFASGPRLLRTLDGSGDNADRYIYTGGMLINIYYTGGSRLGAHLYPGSWPIRST